MQKLKDLSQPKCTVIREGKTIEIKSEDLVVGDSLIVEEGTSITADGIIVHSNDFSVNESILTGESFAVFKDKSSFPYSKRDASTTLSMTTLLQLPFQNYPNIIR